MHLWSNLYTSSAFNTSEVKRVSISRMSSPTIFARCSRPRNSSPTIFARVSTSRNSNFDAPEFEPRDICEGFGDDICQIFEAPEFESHDICEVFEAPEFEPRDICEVFEAPELKSHDICEGFNAPQLSPTYLRGFDAPEFESRDFCEGCDILEFESRARVSISRNSSPTIFPRKLRIFPGVLHLYYNSHFPATEAPGVPSVLRLYYKNRLSSHSPRVRGVLHLYYKSRLSSHPAYNVCTTKVDFPATVGVPQRRILRLHSAIFCTTKDVFGHKKLEDDWPESSICGALSLCT